MLQNIFIKTIKRNDSISAVKYISIFSKNIYSCTLGKMCCCVLKIAPVKI